MSNRKLLLLGLAVAVLSAITGFVVQKYFFTDRQQQPVTSQAKRLKPEDMLGKPRPVFELPDLQGRMRSITEWDNRVVLVNFWATWCPPCKDEIPDLIRLQETYRDKGVQVIGIALQEAEEVHAFAKELGMNYPVLAGEVPVIEVARAYGNHIGALPYSVVFDAHGIIRFIRPGVVHYQEAEEVITNILAVSGAGPGGN